MGRRVLMVLIKWLSPLLVLLLTMLAIHYMKYKEYISITVIYLILNYYIFIIITSVGKSHKGKKLTLYYWLDELDGEVDILKVFQRINKKKDVMKNLELVNETLKKHYDITRMKLLRAYFKALSEEGPYDMLFKTIIGILVAIIIWGINRGYILEFIKIKSDIPSTVSPIYLTILNYATLVLEGFLIFTVVIKDYFIHKRRNKIMIEILDVCIDEKVNN